MKKRILVIDGMYYANRTLGGMRADDETFTLDTEQQQENFKSQLHNSLTNLMASFINDNRNLIHNILYVTDYGSWRKKIAPHQPKYYRDLAVENTDAVIPPMGYKDNRKEKKDESPVNYDKFYEVVGKFNDEVAERVPFISVKDLEGDDLIMLLSRTFKRINTENSGSEYEMLVFCTDGDLIQCVNDSTMLFRNIRSKDSPAGEFVISYPKFHELFIAAQIDNPATKLLRNSVVSDYADLFRMQLNNDYPIERKPGISIVSATPVSLALKKCICGDEKDNIFPILRKFTGDRKRSISEKELIKTFEMIVGKFNEKNCFNIFKDEEARRDLFVTLRSVFKTESYPIDEMEKHFKHNERVNVLSPNNLDREYVEQFVEKFNAIKQQLDEPIDVKGMLAMKRVRDNAGDLLARSVPDSLHSQA